MNYRYEMTFSALEELLSNPAGIAIAGMGLLVAFVLLQKRFYKNTVVHLHHTCWKVVPLHAPASFPRHSKSFS